MSFKSKLIVTASIAMLSFASPSSAQSFNRLKDGGLHAGITPSQQNEIAAHRSGLYAFSSVHHAAVGVRRHGFGR
jgi:hypothetical protein